MVRTSYLRVYQRLASFPEEERRRWPTTSGEGEAVDLRSSRRWLLSGSLPGGGAGGFAEGAFMRTVDGTILVCPWRTRLRMLSGLIAFRASLPDEVAEAFVPEAEARRAASELAALADRLPEVRSHIVHANWHVPIRWFVAFEDSQRILTEDSRGLRIRYESSLFSACERVVKAIAVLEESWIEESVVEALKELGEWLGGFEDDGLLELDYGSVAGIFSEDELVEDHAAGQVWGCVESLAAGDVVQATRIFSELTERWTNARSLEVAN